jgi:hypothetical protein
MWIPKVLNEFTIKNTILPKRPHVFFHTWKIDPKDEHIHKNKHGHIQTHIWNMSVIVELLCGTWGKKERKRKW